MYVLDQTSAFKYGVLVITTRSDKAERVQAQVLLSTGGLPALARHWCSMSKEFCVSRYEMLMRVGLAHEIETTKSCISQQWHRRSSGSVSSGAVHEPKSPVIIRICVLQQQV